MPNQKILRHLRGGFVVVEGPDGEAVKVKADEVSESKPSEKPAVEKTTRGGRRSNG